MSQIKLFYSIGSILLVTLSSFFTITENELNSTSKTYQLTAVIQTIEKNKITIRDAHNAIYTIPIDSIKANIGDEITFKYNGSIQKETELQNIKILNYTTAPLSKNTNDIPNNWLDQGMYQKQYEKAYQTLKGMTQEEKIAQLLLVRFPDSSSKELQKKYQFGGYIFFAKDFRQNETQTKKMIQDVQDVSKIPLLTAVDEEGGSVVRVSSHTSLAKEKFKSPSDLYTLGGFSKIKEDTVEKSRFLKNLGLNLNLAPVVDVSTDPKDYMYSRSIGLDTTKTSTYAKTVIEASKNTGVSYTLKHFPGYGNNQDTHIGTTKDNRTLAQIKKTDLPPFEAGIKAGAEAVLISHNTVTNIDAKNPASLSPSVHNLLRNNLNFTGIIITDALDMGAITNTKDAVVKALLAGNDLLIVTDYEEAIKSIKNAIENKTISETLIDQLAFRIIAWKYEKGLLKNKE